MPIPGSVFIVESNALQAELFRVVSVTESSSSEGGLEYTVTALKYNESKFDAVERDLVLQEPPTRVTAPNPPLKPMNVKGVAYITTDGQFKLQISWNYPQINGSRDPFTTAFVVQYKEGRFGAWAASAGVSGTSYDSGNLPSGTYYARVASINLFGDVSDWVETGEILLAIIPQVLESPVVVGVPWLIKEIIARGIVSRVRLGSPRLAREGQLLPDPIEVPISIGLPGVNPHLIEPSGIEATGSVGTPELISPIETLFYASADQLALNNGDRVASWDNFGTVGGAATQDQAELQPGYFTNQLNALPGVSFNGIDQYLQFEHSAPLLPVGDWAIVILAYVDTSQAYTALLHLQAPDVGLSGVYILVDGAYVFAGQESSYYPFYDAMPQTDGRINSGEYIFVFAKSGQTYSTYINGIFSNGGDLTAQVPLNSDGVPYRSYIGGYYYETVMQSRLLGKIYQISILPTANVDAINSVGNALQAKYAIAWTQIE